MTSGECCACRVWGGRLPLGSDVGLADVHHDVSVERVGVDEVDRVLHAVESVQVVPLDRCSQQPRPAVVTKRALHWNLIALPVCGVVCVCL